MVFPVVMYGCESWTVKKAECRIDAFELWCWRRLLRVPWTARRFNKSILKEISPEYSLEGLMLKLKLHVRHGLAIQFLHDSIHVRIPILPNHPTLSLSLWGVIHIEMSSPREGGKRENRRRGPEEHLYF